jgi:dTDP-4-amino-4,6-dideoxygalactose transaminase
MIGYNYRMTEIEAAIGIQQLKKVDALIEARLKNVKMINEAIGSIAGFTPQPYVEETSLHTYYIQPFKYSKEVLGIHRNDFVAAIKAEIPTSKMREAAPLIGAGYVKPLYLQPVYQQRAAFAFTNDKFQSEVDYSQGSCPVVERMHFDELITTEFMRPGMTKKDIEDVIRAFEKVVKYRNELETAELSVAGN